MASVYVKAHNATEAKRRANTLLLKERRKGMRAGPAHPYQKLPDGRMVWRVEAIQVISR
jgi:hypothetical protein